MAKSKHENPEAHYQITRAHNPATPDSVLLFYNPGSKIQGIVPYDHPIRIKGSQRDHQPAYCPIHVEERGFFEAPTAVLINAPEQGLEDVTATIDKMYERIMSQYRTRGLILVESPPHKSRANDDRIAPTMEDAMELGDRLYESYLRDMAREWYTLVARTKSEGGVPTSATGLYATALKRLKIADPADTVGTMEAERANNTANKELTDRIAALEQLLMSKNTAPVAVTK